MSEKSYVSMGLCPICRKENGTILMDRRIKDSLERFTIDPTHVCDKCKEKYLERGVMLIEPHNGNLIVLKDEAFQQMFDKKLPKEKIAFVTQELLDSLQSQIEK
jgi:transcriptional regulator NrdR family protein